MVILHLTSRSLIQILSIVRLTSIWSLRFSCDRARPNFILTAWYAHSCRLSISFLYFRELSCSLLIGCHMKKLFKIRFNIFDSLFELIIFFNYPDLLRINACSRWIQILSKCKPIFFGPKCPRVHISFERSIFSIAIHDKISSCRGRCTLKEIFNIIWYKILVTTSPVTKNLILKLLYFAH